MEIMGLNGVVDNYLKHAYEGKRILITGNTGFKGSWLSIWLQKLGANVIGYSLQPPTEPSMFRLCRLDEKIPSIIADVRDEVTLSAAFKRYKPDMVFHLAAQPLVRQSYAHPKETYETNVMGTVNLLEAARNTDTVKAVVVITTDKCYENKEWVYGYRETDPMGGYDPYSSSKGCAELIVSAYRNSFFNRDGIALASARAGNVIGGGDWATDRLIPDFVRAVVQDKPIIIRNPLAIRPWQHVLEPLSGYLLLGVLLLTNQSKYSSAWNFGPRNTDVLSVEKILKLAIQEWGKGSIVIDGREQPHEAELLKLDASKAQAYLRWHPLYDARKAVAKTVQWYRKYHEDKCEYMYEYSLRQIEEYELLLKNINL